MTKRPAPLVPAALFGDRFVAEAAMIAPAVTVTPAPATIAERITSLDVLRGVAILGILIMNIQSFAMPAAAYMNPSVYGDLTGANGWVWRLSHFFADQKFITLFSMMFGAGILLMTGRAEAKGLKSAGLHYRRTFGLLLIGLAHAYLLWHGDILVTYALCAVFVFLFRRRSARTLLIVGLVFNVIPTLTSMGAQFSMEAWSEEDYAESVELWAPGPETLEEELGAFRGGWTAQMGHRASFAFMFETFVFLVALGWRAGGLMPIGMALYKWGVLSAERSRRFYWMMAIGGLVVGIPLITQGIVQNTMRGWPYDWSMFVGSQFNYWGAPFVSLAYIGLVMLACQSTALKGVTGRFAAVGRMALTNYVMQTVICTLLFYGHGVGLFGSVSRIGQVGVVIAVWAFHLIVSPIWLRRFRFGPAEWLWRTMTYRAPQPIRV